MLATTFSRNSVSSPVAGAKPCTLASRPWLSGDWCKLLAWGLSGSFYLLELSCAGFRHSAGFHVRVILDDAACRLKKLGDMRDVLGVLGVVLVVPSVLCVLVLW